MLVSNGAERSKMVFTCSPVAPLVLVVLVLVHVAGRELDLLAVNGIVVVFVLRFGLVLRVRTSGLIAQANPIRLPIGAFLF